MKKLLGLQDWIHERRKNDPSWKLPDSTIQFMDGLESDLEELSQQLGIDLCIMTIRETEN